MVSVDQITPQSDEAEPTADGAPLQQDRPTLLAYVRTAFAPRMLLLLVLFLAAATVCARLGVWQIDRAQERGEMSAKHAAEEATQTSPAELGEVLAPQEGFAGALVGKRVRVTGEFEPDGQLFVEGRVHDGELGYLVLTPLRVTDDGLDGQTWTELSGPPALPIVRGWVPSPDAADFVPPTGSVELTGYLQASEAVALGMVEPGVTDSISSGALANKWSGPIYSGYLVQSVSEPAGDPAVLALPRPTIEGGTGLNLQNLFYAIQWWVFGGFALALWVRLVRDETRGGSADGFEGFEAYQPNP